MEGMRSEWRMHRAVYIATAAFASILILSQTVAAGFIIDTAIRWATTIVRKTIEFIIFLIKSWLTGFATLIIPLLTSKTIIAPKINEGSYLAMAGFIMQVIMPIVVFAIIFTALKLLTSASNPGERAAAKSQLQNLLVGLIIIPVSPHLYQLLIDASYQITIALLGNDSTAGIYQTVVKGQSLADAIIAAYAGSSGLESIFIFICSLTVTLMAISMIFIRYMLIVLFAMLMPLTCLLYLFDFTKSIGRKFLKYSLTWAFVPVVMATWCIIAGITMVNTGSNGLDSYSGGFMSISFLLMIVLSPLMLTGALETLGAMLTGIGQMTGGGQGAALVAAGQVMQAKDAESLVTMGMMMGAKAAIKGVKGAKSGLTNMAKMDGPGGGGGGGMGAGGTAGKAGGQAGSAAGGGAGSAGGAAGGAALGGLIGAIAGSIVPVKGTAIGAKAGAKMGAKVGEKVGGAVGKAVGKAVGTAIGTAVDVAVKTAVVATKVAVKGASVAGKAGMKAAKVAGKAAKMTAQVAGKVGAGIARIGRPLTNLASKAATSAKRIGASLANPAQKLMDMAAKNMGAGKKGLGLAQYGLAGIMNPKKVAGAALGKAASAYKPVAKAMEAVSKLKDTVPGKRIMAAADAVSVKRGLSIVGGNVQRTVQDFYSGQSSGPGIPGSEKAEQPARGASGGGSASTAPASKAPTRGGVIAGAAGKAVDAAVDAVKGAGTAVRGAIDKGFTTLGNKFMNNTGIGRRIGGLISAGKGRLAKSAGGQAYLKDRAGKGTTSPTGAIGGFVKAGMVATGIAMLGSVAAAGAPLAGTLAGIGLGGYLAKKAFGGSGLGASVGATVKSKPGLHAVFKGIGASGAVNTARAYRSLGTAGERRGFVIGKGIGMALTALEKAIQFGFITMPKLAMEFAATGGLNLPFRAGASLLKAPGKIKRGIGQLVSARKELRNRSTPGDQMHKTFGKGTATKLQNAGAKSMGDVARMRSDDVGNAIAPSKAEARASAAKELGVGNPDGISDKKAMSAAYKELSSKGGDFAKMDPKQRAEAVKKRAGEIKQERTLSPGDKQAFDKLADEKYRQGNPSMDDARAATAKDLKSGSYNNMSDSDKQAFDKLAGEKYDSMRAPLDQQAERVHDAAAASDPTYSDLRKDTGNIMSMKDSEKMADAGWTTEKIAKSSEQEVLDGAKSAGATSINKDNVGAIQANAARTVGTPERMEGGLKQPGSPDNWQHLKDSMTWGGMQKQRNKGSGEHLEEMLEDRDETPSQR
jgi:hypothetical protein